MTPVERDQEQRKARGCLILAVLTAAFWLAVADLVYRGPRATIGHLAIAGLIGSGVLLLVAGVRALRTTHRGGGGS